MKAKLGTLKDFENDVNFNISFLRYPDSRRKADRVQTVELKLLSDNIRELRHDSENTILVRHVEYLTGLKLQKLKDSQRREAVKRVAANIRVFITEADAEEVFGMNVSTLTLLKKITGLSFLKINGEYQYSWRELQSLYRQMNSPKAL
ncbi:MAG: hypothetical protein MK198_13805 [Gracilimonas sp.]|uniref:hypothetical protein n=1 Tax=Gracilimonas sp. TaxID=1974203 RepID=UPI00375080E8|nr:hypothetical protein [Gracilimonas sp.]